MANHSAGHQPSPPFVAASILRNFTPDLCPLVSCAASKIFGAGLIRIYAANRILPGLRDARPIGSTCAPRAYANRTSRHAETTSSPIAQAPSTLRQSLGTCVLSLGSQTITQHKSLCSTEATFPTERFPCGASPSRLHIGQRELENL